MAKDPAFLFYPNDWIGGTMGMSFEEKGAYMELLMMQFNIGHMGGHMIGQLVGQLWDKVKHKFNQDSNGLWYNERLDLEKEKRQNFTATRRNNILGVNQYTKKEPKKVGHTGGHMIGHMENEDVNEDVNTVTKKTKIEKKDYSFILPEFLPAFETWMAYKSERSEKYKSIASEKAFYSKLLKLSSGKSKIAQEIVEQSMANNWAGIFELKQGQQKQEIKAYKPKPLIQ